jgi:uncharacterized spore protein YtfJ
VDVVKSFGQLREALSARIVFGTPVEREGVTVIPAASVFGGGGLGGGEEATEGAPPGGGGGYGIAAWPAGAFEVRDDRVEWHQAFDSTRFAVSVLFFGVVALRAILAARR